MNVSKNQQNECRIKEIRIKNISRVLIDKIKNQQNECRIKEIRIKNNLSCLDR